MWNESIIFKHPVMAAKLGIAIGNFAASGFKKSNDDKINERKSICNSCDKWDLNGFNGSGRCLLCGCSTWAKIRMESEKCPIDKW